MDKVIVYKGRTNVLPVSLGIDVSLDTITSQIRAAPDSASTLLAPWVVSFLTNGTDGELILTMDDSVSGAVEAERGYMDLKRVSGGEPLPVFDEPLEVYFRGTVTA